MKTITILSILIFYLQNVYSQTMPADSSNFIMYNHSSRVISSVNDTVFLDLDGDFKYDAAIWRNEWKSYACHNPDNLNKSINIAPFNGFEVLFKHEGGYAGLHTPVKIQYGETYKDSIIFTSGPLNLYYDIRVYDQCFEFDFGWNENDLGFFELRKINNADTNYYLVKTRIFDAAKYSQSFQIVLPNDSIFTNISTKNSAIFEVYLRENNITIFNNSTNGEIIRVFDIQGRLIHECKKNEKTKMIDISNFHKGLYIISISDCINGKTEIHKIIKSK